MVRSRAHVERSCERSVEVGEVGVVLRVQRDPVRRQCFQRSQRFTRALLSIRVAGRSASRRPETEQTSHNSRVWRSLRTPSFYVIAVPAVLLMGLVQERIPERFRRVGHTAAGARGTGAAGGRDHVAAAARDGRDRAAATLARPRFPPARMAAAGGAARYGAGHRVVRRVVGEDGGRRRRRV